MSESVNGEVQMYGWFMYTCLSFFVYDLNGIILTEKLTAFFIPILYC